MSTTESTGTFSSGILIGDQASGAPVTPTLVGSTKISSCLELQSTTTAFTPPRMTSVQISAITPAVDGMTAYATDFNAPAVRTDGLWQYPIAMQSLTLLASQVKALTTTPVTILPALTAGSAYVVYMAVATLNYTGTVFASVDGTIRLYFNGGANVNALSSDFTNAFVVENGSFREQFFASTTAPAKANTDGLALSVTNPLTAFTGGGTSSITINVWYSIISD